MSTKIDPATYRSRRPNKVALAGDWHGAWNWAIRSLDELAGQGGVDLLLHLGDFGFWPGTPGKHFVGKVEEAAARNGIDIWVTLGNHEDWSRMRALWDVTDNNRDADGNELPLRISEHITVLPRGWRFTLTAPSGHDVSFVSLGGAPSLDYPWRRQGHDWWPEEMILDEHVDLVAASGYADVMLAHDAPDIPYATGKVAWILEHPEGWTPEGLAWAAQGRERMTRAFRAVKPRLFAHGHFHVADQAWVQVEDVDYPTRVLALNCDQASGNLAILDLDWVADRDSWGGDQ